MKNLKGYDLPLSTAYPVFAWRMLVRSGRLVGIVHTDDDFSVLPGDTIITREAPLDTVVMVREAIDRLRNDANDEQILFDISPSNLQRINKYNYEKIYRH